MTANVWLVRKPDKSRIKVWACQIFIGTNTSGSVYLGRDQPSKQNKTTPSDTSGPEAASHACWGFR